MALRCIVSRVCYLMMVLVSHPDLDAIVSEEQATRVLCWIYKRWDIPIQVCVCVYMSMCISRSLERDLNREPQLAAFGVNSKMSKLDDEDHEEAGTGAIRGDDLFTRVGRVMNWWKLVNPEMPPSPVHRAIARLLSTGKSSRIATESRDTNDASVFSRD